MASITIMGVQVVCLILLGIVGISTSMHTYKVRPDICNAGQAYWCKNITTAVGCRALKHCIRGVWEKEIPIEVDTSTVCQTCIDMVKQARDQLQSNETQSEIREVLESTCKVVPTKTLRHDCEKLMDDFGSYLVDTLASEMNPQVVCSVAGLCNNAAFTGQKPQQIKKSEEVQLTCNSCHSLMRQIEGKVETATKDDLTNTLFRLCGNLGSYSDVCSETALSNLPQIGAVLSENVRAGPVCSLAGICTHKYHSHAQNADANEDAEEESEEVEMVGDLPCDLCEQLVKHLRDVLVANTTEDEFKMVLLGLCNQMGGYKDECRDLVETYYSEAYSFLVNELDGQVVCSQIGICPTKVAEVLRPLIRVDAIDPADSSLPENRQLPLERFHNPALSLVPKRVLEGMASRGNREVCAFCEYLLHFIQQEITLPSNERKIRESIEKVCTRLPNSVAGECISFVEDYTDAFVALLANRIDPSQVCPSLGVCPADGLVIVEFKDKPTCPLCLLAFGELLRKAGNSSIEDIEDALDDLCIRDVFPNSLTTECAKFIMDYRPGLGDMILAGFTEEEACLYTELCAYPSSPAVASHRFSKGGRRHHSHHQGAVQSTSGAGSVETNAIKQDIENPNTCVLCEFVITKLEKILRDKTTEEEIKEGVYKVCNYMPRTVTAQCKEFITKYADLIISLLVNEMDPKQICTEIHLCGDKVTSVVQSHVRRCLTCEVLMDALRTVLTDRDIDEDLNVSMLKACRKLPTKEANMCSTLVVELAPQLETALQTLPVGPLVCRRVGLCSTADCLQGPDYWCQSPENTILCQAEDYCKEYAGKSVKPERLSHLRGTVTI